MQTVKANIISKDETGICKGTYIIFTQQFMRVNPGALYVVMKGDEIVISD